MPVILERFGLILFLAIMAQTLMAQTTSRPLPAPQGGAEIPSRPLLMEPRIQKEIGLTPKQRNNLAELEDEVAASRQGLSADAGDEGFDFQAMIGGADEVDRQRRSAIAKLLTPAQKNRLLQIEWQREGWLALGRPDVAGRLKLRPTQIQQIQSIIRAMRQAQTQALFSTTPAPDAAKTRAKLNPSNGFIDRSGTLLPGGGPLNFSADQLRVQAGRSAEAADKIRDQSASEVDQVLNPDQKTEFERLLGPPFDFKSMSNPAPAELTPKIPKSSTKKASKAR